MRYWIFILLLIPTLVHSQTANIRGTISSEDGEPLPYAHLIVLPDSVTMVSDSKGRYTLKVSLGRKTLMVSFMGFESLEKIETIIDNTMIDFELSPKINELNEVIITYREQPHQELFESTGSSVNTITGKDVGAIPVLGGEADPIKVLQLLPGTIRGVEGSADLFVRGGAADQNLIQLDGATVYNTSHLFGFVSVFNPDILDKVSSINGAFPAQYGGRLSSILNVGTHANIANKTHVKGNVGLIASRLYVEQPVIKEKLSVWVAARRTYIDQVAKRVGQEVPYFFYDINAKITTQLTEHDNLSFSYYGGEDILDVFQDANNDGDGIGTNFNSGNNSQTLGWKRQLPNSWQAEVDLGHTAYKYDINTGFDMNSLQSFSDIRDFGASILVSNNLFNGKNIKVIFGVDWINHNVSPSIVSSRGIISEIIESTEAPGRKANEFAIHASYQFQLNERWLVNAGLRTSAGVVSNKTYVNPEPRLSARYKISDNKALKISYSRMVQYINRISSSAISTPTDVWYPVTEVIKPQTSHQVTASFQQNIDEHNIFGSVEAYYKSMNNLVGLKEGTDLFFDTNFEPKIVQGLGSAYGLEFLLRKDAGKFSGWLSYTLSWSRRQFDEINQGDWFSARYDRRHNGAIVAQYQIHKRWSLSAVWEYISGSRFTPIIGQYGALAPSLTGVDLIPVFAPTNSVALANTHRLDFGLKFISPSHHKFKYEWFIGVYNAYNRASPIAINIKTNEDGSLNYEQPGIFGLLPFISYGFEF